jgi:cell wall integrity and stress response component
MSLKLFAVSSLLAFSRLVLATGEGTEVAAESPISGTDTVHGCYSYVDNLTLNSTNEFNSQGACATICRDLGKYVGATQAEDCYCGDEYPPLNTLVDDDECTEPCPGYGTEACGGIDTWTVYNTGVRVSVANEANITDTSSTSASSSVAASTTSQAVSTSAGMSWPYIFIFICFILIQ